MENLVILHINSTDPYYDEVYYEIYWIMVGDGSEQRNGEYTKGINETHVWNLPENVLEKHTLLSHEHLLWLQIPSL